MDSVSCARFESAKRDFVLDSGILKPLRRSVMIGGSGSAQFTEWVGPRVRLQICHPEVFHTSS